MGSSIWLVVLVPFMAVYAIFGGIKGAILGYPPGEVILPYDEASGTVWKYDGIDDPYIGLDETRIDGDKQIFVFSARKCEDEDKYQGEMMYLVFTDRNGNKKAYYCPQNGKLNTPKFYPEEECRTVDFTLTAKKPKSRAKWEAVLNAGHILVQPTEKSDTQTFTAVMTPSNESRTYHVDFAYTNIFGKYREEATVWLELSNDGCTVSDIRHETLIEKWIDDLTNGLF